MCVGSVSGKVAGRLETDGLVCHTGTWHMVGRACDFGDLGLDVDVGGRMEWVSAFAEEGRICPLRFRVRWAGEKVCWARTGRDGLL